MKKKDENNGHGNYIERTATTKPYVLKCLIILLKFLI
jgi:hypothetical protein